MAKTLNDISELVPYLENLFKDIQGYSIELGIIQGESDNRKENEKGVTNAELMFIHEYGSPLNGIPERPVLHMTINHYKTSKELNYNIAKSIAKYFETGRIETFEQYMKRFCFQVQGYARDIIYSNDGRLAPNSPSVAAKKKGNHPLFDTGQLARSIVCRLNKNK